MIVIILLLTLAFTGVSVLALMAGGSEKRKTAQILSLAGLGISASAGVAILFGKEAIKEILLKKTPHLAFMAENIVIPYHVVLQFALTVFFCGVILFLWSYNCRKNSSKWYWALLWTLGIVFLTGHLLFLPQYYGIAAFVNFFTTATRDVFSLDMSMLPTVYVMLLVNLIGALLWLWYTLESAKHSWRNLLSFAGIFAGFVLLLWFAASGAGAWAKYAVDTKAAELGITPFRVAEQEPPELKAPDNHEFYTRHAKYNPPRSGKYDWKKDTIPADEKEYTMNFFTSLELEKYLDSLKKSAAYIAKTDVLYLSALQHFRSLVRHRVDIAELYYRSNQKEKVLPELLKYPALESLIPADTPFLICELVRTAARSVWVDALIQYGPEDREFLPVYRNLLDWSKNWQVHLPCEAGFYLTAPPGPQGVVAEFFCTPYLNTARYRGFSDAVNRIPELKNLEQQQIISADGMYANAAKRQRSVIIMGQTALALKVYKMENGKYPEKLSELVPRYLSGEYVSPCTGERLDYSVKDADFTLSSDGRIITSER